MKILLIEDDPKISASLKKGLEDLHHQVVIAKDAKSGQQAALNKKYDLIILDIMLQGINGLTICRNIRERQLKTPILILSALNSTQHIINGLNAGADDYLTKPFHFSELVARVHVLAHRKYHYLLEERMLKLADLQLNTHTRTASRQEKEIKLTAKEFALLELLMRNKGKVINRTIIADAVWGRKLDTRTNIIIDVYVNFLRSKIDKDFPGNPLIYTIIGMGYVMKATI